nr:TRAP transporter small permease [uncultured Dethiosulfovibrio sp.]
MEYFTERVERILANLSIAVTGAMTVGVIALVFSRYVLGITYIWAEESISVLFLSTTYLGAALGVRYDEHIRIDLFTDRLSIPGKKIVSILQIAVVIALQLVLLKVCFYWIGKVGNTLTPGLRIPTKFIYSLFPLNLLLVIFFEISRLIGMLRKKSWA